MVIHPEVVFVKSNKVPIGRIHCHDKSPTSTLGVHLAVDLVRWWRFAGADRMASAAIHARVQAYLHALLIIVTMHAPVDTNSFRVPTVMLVCGTQMDELEYIMYAQDNTTHRVSSSSNR